MLLSFSVRRQALPARTRRTARAWWAAQSSHPGGEQGCRSLLHAAGWPSPHRYRRFPTSAGCGCAFPGPSPAMPEAATTIGLGQPLQDGVHQHGLFLRLVKGLADDVRFPPGAGRGCSPGSAGGCRHSSPEVGVDLLQVFRSGPGGFVPAEFGWPCTAAGSGWRGPPCRKSRRDQATHRRPGPGQRRCGSPSPPRPQTATSRPLEALPAGRGRSAGGGRASSCSRRGQAGISAAAHKADHLQCVAVL